jgi:hypothetical protein
VLGKVSIANVLGIEVSNRGSISKLESDKVMSPIDPLSSKGDTTRSVIRYSLSIIVEKESGTLQHISSRCSGNLDS